MHDVIQSLRAQHHLFGPALADILCSRELEGVVRTVTADKAQIACLAIGALEEFPLDPATGESLESFYERRDGTITFRLVFDRIGNLLGDFDLAERSQDAMPVLAAVAKNLGSVGFRRAAIRRRLDRTARVLLHRARQRGLRAWHETMSGCDEKPACDECRARADAASDLIIVRAERRILRRCLSGVRANSDADSFSSTLLDLLIDTVRVRHERRLGVARAA